MKVCTKCNIKKEYSEFGKSKGGKDGYSSQCKECVKEYNKQYHQSNRDYLNKMSREYYKKNPEYLKKNKDKIKEYKKQYHIDNSKKIQQKVKQWRIDNEDRYQQYKIDNRDKILLKRKQYHIDNKEKEKQWRLENKENISQKGKKYHRENKEKRREYKKQYRIDNNKMLSDRLKNRKKTDLIFKLNRNYRSLIRQSFIKKNYTKKTLTYKILGCSFIDFANHLNDNKYGFFVGGKELDLDHIVPASLATTKKELLKLNHYSNFQLLPSYYNRHIKRDLEWDINHFEKWLNEYS